MSDEKKPVSFVVTYTNDIGGVDTPLEAAKECLDGILNQGARVFEVKNNTTGERVTVDLEEEDEDAVVPVGTHEKTLSPDDLVEIYHAIDSECISDTENVSMTTIRKIFAKYGADYEKMF